MTQEVKGWNVSQRCRRCSVAIIGIAKTDVSALFDVGAANLIGNVYFNVHVVLTRPRHDVTPFWRNFTVLDTVCLTTYLWNERIRFVEWVVTPQICQ